MKSPMIERMPNTTDKSGYTDLQVCRSAAGFYIGTMWVERDLDGDVVSTEPGSRDSDYYKSRREAEAALRLMAALGDETAAHVLRHHP